MSGNNRRREDEEEEGWESMLMKVAGAAAAAATVAGGIYALFKQPSQEPDVAFGARAVPNQGIGWTKPEVGWVKLNVDGSLLPQSAVCAGVLRNSSGEWLGGFAKKLSPTSKPDETERMALFEGLEWARKRGYTKVCVESDNEGVVYLVENGLRSNDPVIDDIRQLLRDRDWETRLTWIKRDANEVADKLADYARRFNSFDDFDSPPDDCIPSLFKDKQ